MDKDRSSRSEVSYKFRKTHNKTPVPESFFLIKLQEHLFKIPKNTFFCRPPPVATSVRASNISNSCNITFLKHLQ